MVDPVVVGNNIFAGRKRLGLSQSGLGDTLRVSHQAVSKWERGECLPDIDALVELAKRFGTTIDELLRERIEKDPETETKPAIPEEGAVIWRRMQEKIREQIAEQSFRTYFEPTAAFLDENGDLIVQCAEWLFTRYMHMLIPALDAAAGRSEVKIRIIHASRYGADRQKARFQTDRISLGIQEC
jgi:Predicted transcriptional regulators